MTITKEISGTVATLFLDGWLDTQSSPELGEAVDELLGKAQSLVFDMEKLKYISSSGVRQVVASHKKFEGNFSVKNVPANIMEVFSATGLNKRIRIE